MENNSLLTIQFDTGTGSEKEALFAVDSHPVSNIVSTGDITGQINLYSYTSDETYQLIRSLPCLDTKSSCRALKFSSKGNRLFCGTENKEVTVSDVETGQQVKCISDAHSSSVYSMLIVSEGVLVSGDESGEIKIWDTRSWKAPFSFKENHDFISSMAVDDGKRTLLAASGDGSLCVFDLRKRVLEQRSDSNESELLSLAIVKGGKKVVCGNGEGSLMIYNWGLWGDITDRYPCHPQSIDCMVPLNDSVVCTGCMDGLIRSVQILPNEMLGTVGQQSSTALSIDSMCLTHDKEFLLTGSHDCLKFWPVPAIPTLPSHTHPSGKRKTKAEVVDTDDTYARKKKRKQKKKDDHDATFFSDL